VAQPASQAHGQPPLDPACSRQPASQALAPGRSIERQGAALLLRWFGCSSSSFFFFLSIYFY
jgi:hypothetical protein